MQSPWRNQPRHHSMRSHAAGMPTSVPNAPARGRKRGDAPAQKRLIRAHDGNEREHESEGDPDRRLAKGVQARIEPVGSRGKSTRVEPEAELCGRARGLHPARGPSEQPDTESQAATS